MELYEVLGCYCNRNSGAVSKDDKRKYSYMLRSNTLKGIKDDGDMSFIKG